MRHPCQSSQKSDEAALKTLREKDCYFMKADKGNSVAVPTNFDSE
jgi:hypothetical protein